jgi:glycosyltransferase involved in cell wall biosynthesis
MRRVLVCKCELLHPSETFIREQILSYRSWTPIVVGFRQVTPGLPVDALDVRWLDEPTPTRWGARYRKLLAALDQPLPHAVRRLRRESASLAHAHFATDAVKFWPIVRRLNLPLVITLHGYDVNIYRECWEHSSRSLSERQYPKRLLSLARQPRVHFVAVSQAIRQRAVEYGIPSDRIHVHYIGIDLTRFRPSDRLLVSRAPRILFVGRLVEKKGLEYLIRAYERIRATLPAAELVVIGDGPLYSKLTGLASQLNVPVQFLGSVDNAEVKREMDKSRVFCLPSLIAEDGDAEGCPIALLEAQACAVPVVTSARGGATEGILDGITGLAFPEKDVELLTMRLMSVLTDDGLALSMSHAGPRLMAERFDIRNCTASLELLYDAVVGPDTGGQFDSA